MASATPSILVTGASGFIGQALVEALVAKGLRVRTLQRRKTATLARWEQRGEVEVHLGSVEDARAVSDAVRGVETIFHVAALAGIWGSYDAYFRANVVGTRNVLDAARAHGVAKLVYTSSPSIVHAGRDQEGIDESTPIPLHHAAPYPATKAIAEREVLAANDASLSTVALRPHLVWGPGDRHIGPRLVERARRGRLVLVGGGRKRIDATYIDSAVHAHWLAWQRLGPRAACAGKAYFIAQGEPMPARDLVVGIVRAYGVEPRVREVPLALAKALGASVEFFWRWTHREDEPPITRFLAEQLGTAHWYSLARAERDLGYRAPVTTADGLAQLAAWARRDAGSERQASAPE